MHRELRLYLGATLSDKSKISDKESELFRDAVKGSRRLHNDKIIQNKKPPPPLKRSNKYKQDAEDELETQYHGLSDLHEEANVGAEDELSYARSGVQNSVLRKLKRAQFPIEAELDLHKLTREQAKSALVSFLSGCTNEGIRCIRLIHGKGYGSADKIPVLKANVDHWLRQRDDVLAFCSAARDDGGAGALYILLKRL